MLSYCLHVPLLALFLAAGTLLSAQFIYHYRITPLIDTYRRHRMQQGFYPNYQDEFTYYNRHCDVRDISTSNATDLLIENSDSLHYIRHKMLLHGAVATKNVLSKQTAAALRTYLDNKHVAKRTAPLRYNEVFWEENTSRLSLALGTHDDPAVTQALTEVGNNPQLAKILKALLGEDPAIVEVSTLTSMSGSSFQGLHSDSDWFGSSLLYGQSFLHSYSMFVALQDTTEKLGATTVCPGTHYCADTEDLDQICNDSQFSIATNGQTGTEHGVMEQGDAFLFNQNIWHRGPGNRDTDDRIMLVMTFVTNRNMDKDDLRRQGLGTYYYQRWNMWGHTYSDLAQADARMRQPWRTLRALGITNQGGIPFVHQFSQQVANGDDFFADDILDEYREKVLQDYHLPSWLTSNKESWEPFIQEMLRKWAAVACALYLGLLGVSFCIWMRQSNRSSFKTAILGHVAVATVVLLALTAILQTEWSQSVSSGLAKQRPFSQVVATSTNGPSTVPQRHDVLISNRLDPTYLHAFTRFMDFHPGNREWLHRMREGQEPEAIVDTMTSSFHEGVPTRFLQQNPKSGVWHMMSKEDAVEATKDAAASQDPNVPLPPLAVGSFEGSKVDDNTIRVGDTVWAWIEKYSEWCLGRVEEFLPHDGMRVKFKLYGEMELDSIDVRKYTVFKTGDRVRVDYNEDETQFFEGVVTGAHPSGGLDIQYDDGEFVPLTQPQFVIRL